MHIKRLLMTGILVLLALVFLSACGTTQNPGEEAESDHGSSESTTRESTSTKETKDPSNPNETETGSGSESDTGTETEDKRTDYEKFGPILLLHEGFETNPLTMALQMTVSEEVEHIDLSLRFVPVVGCTWALYADYEGLVPYPLKSMSLEIGDNKAYVVVYSPDKDRFTRYEIHIFREVRVNYSFVSDGKVIGQGETDNAKMVSAPFTPSLPGRKFECWTVNGQPVTLPLKLSEDTVFVARFTYLDYKITLNAAGGEVSPAVLNLHYGDSFELPEPTREGFVFLGWFQGSTRVTDGVYEKQTDTELTAHWEEILSAGEEIKWSFDESTGVLTMTGEGEMLDFLSTSAQPWAKYRSDIRRVVIDERITTLGNYAFSGCTNLESVRMSDMLTSIGMSAFSGCVKLKSIDLGVALSKLGMQAFYGCSSVSQVTIPDTLQIIPESAFAGTGLLSIETNRVTRIDTNAFASCQKLSTVVIGDAVKSIAEKAFYECPALASVTIGKGLEILETEAFARCQKLSEVRFNAVACEDCKVQTKPFNKADIEDDSVPSIALTIGSGVTRIPAYLFFGGKTKLASVTFEGDSSCAEIGMSAFENCRQLSTVLIPKPVRKIGSKAFFGCVGLSLIEWDAESLDPQYPLSTMSMIFGFTDEAESKTAVVVGKDVKEIPAYAFFYADIISLTFDENTACEKIGAYAFARNAHLTVITLPSSLSSIEATAFAAVADNVNCTFAGTAEQLAQAWTGDEPSFIITCSDGVFPEQTQPE